MSDKHWNNPRQKRHTYQNQCVTHHPITLFTPQCMLQALVPISGTNDLGHDVCHPFCVLHCVGSSIQHVRRAVPCFHFATPGALDPLLPFQPFPLSCMKSPKSDCFLSILWHTSKSPWEHGPFWDQLLPKGHRYSHCHTELVGLVILDCPSRNTMQQFSFTLLCAPNVHIFALVMLLTLHA